MASAGYLLFHPSSSGYELTDEYAYFLASDGTDHFVGGMWEMVPALLKVAPRVAEAFEKGGGVAFEEFGPQCVGALDLINRGQYEHRGQCPRDRGEARRDRIPTMHALEVAGRPVDVLGDAGQHQALRRARSTTQVSLLPPP